MLKVLKKLFGSSARRAKACLKLNKEKHFLVILCTQCKG